MVDEQIEMEPALGQWGEYRCQIQGLDVGPDGSFGVERGLTAVGERPLEWAQRTGYRQGAGQRGAAPGAANKGASASWGARRVEDVTLLLQRVGIGGFPPSLGGGCPDVSHRGWEGWTLCRGR
ncbi:hypothetical protein ADL28_03150 [Streptomyces violaceusniger]|uniref:Uncharacterized protein n=1 Tax=Streptomyces violaceusniger TaxID=68280 RepID=A0A0X3XCM2_STRVO|nr:hypothetical protein ADL28_03150 [Streptomyces violaceusniger]